MLFPALIDRTHTFGDRLVLQIDARDAGVAGVGALGGAIDPIVVAFVCGTAESVEPAGGVGYGIGIVQWTPAGGRRAHSRFGHRQRQRVVIVHRNPAAHPDVEPEHSGGHHGVERKEELGDAAVDALRFSRPVRGVHHAGVGGHHFVARRAVRQGVLRPAPVRRVVFRERAGVQKHRVTGIDVTFERLHPVAVALINAERPLAVGDHIGLEVR